MFRFILSATLVFLSGSGFFFQAFAAQKPLRIIGFGDSLMVGYQLDNDKSFAAVLEKALHTRGYQIELVNAGVSGDTTGMGRARLDWSVDDSAGLVILELGANDMLRGINPQITKENLDTMLQNLAQRQIPVLLIGMKSAPNMGEKQAAEFDEIYPQLAQKYQLPLYPFFLDGIAANSDYLLPDGMHPNEQGVEIMVERFLPLMEQTLEQMGRKAQLNG